ncbi:alpha/beta fold hydrolase [Tardiphaga alba]|nr:alpha/beta fold hydrolase [Tardiphaga alba]
MFDKKYSSSIATAYIDAGEGPPVILGHGFLCDARIWTPQIAELSRRYRVIAPDLWGHGDSGALPRGVANNRHVAEQYLALMDELGIDKAAIVGLSFGGMWGAEMIFLQPDRVAALALIGTYLGPEPEASKQSYSQLMETVRDAQGIPAAMQEQILRILLAPATFETKPDVVAIVRHGMSQILSERLADSVLPIGKMIFERRDAASDLVKIRCPCIVMTGLEDVPRPPREGEQMAELIGCPFIALPGAGHTPCLESPDAVTANILRLLRFAHWS